MASLGLVPPAVLEGMLSALILTHAYSNVNLIDCMQRFNDAKNCAGWSMVTGGTDYTLL